MGLFDFFKKKSKKQELDDIIRQYKQVVNEHKSDIVSCDTTSPEYDKIFHSLIDSSFFFYPKKSTNVDEIEFFVAPNEKFANENSQRGQVAICVFEWLQLTYSKNSNLYSHILSVFVEEEKMSIQEHLDYIQSIIKNDSLTQIIRDTKILKAISERLRAYSKIIARFSNSLMRLYAEYENEIIEQCVSGVNDFFLPTEKITAINNLTANDIESIFVRDVLSGKNLFEKEGEVNEEDFTEETHNLGVSKIKYCIDVANDYLQKNDYEIKDYTIDDCYDLVSLWKNKGLPEQIHLNFGPQGGGFCGFDEDTSMECLSKWHKILTGKEISISQRKYYLDNYQGGLTSGCRATNRLLQDINFNLSEITKQKISNQDEYNLIDTFFSETSEYTKFLTSQKSLSIANDEGTCMATLSKNGNYFIYRLDWAKDGKNIGDYVIPFSATQENIEKFNQGCKVIAERLALYIKTNNAKVVPINPPAFGDLTYTEKKKTETKPIDTKGNNTNLSKFVDENGEPMVLKHNCPLERIGKEMTKEELHKFAVELLSDLYENAGMAMVNVNRNYHREYPNIVMKSRNKKSYYVIIETALFPQKAESLYSADFAEMKQYAKEFNATPVFAGMSFMNASREPNKLICGDNYYVAFKGLEAI